MSGVSKPHINLGATQMPSEEQILAAFKAWALADSDPHSDWNIERRTARALVEQFGELQRWAQQVHDALDGRTIDHPDEGPARIIGLLEQYEGCITRESGLALIEDAKRWEKAYREARDELAGTKEQLEAFRSALEYITDDQVIGVTDMKQAARNALASNPASGLNTSSVTPRAPGDSS